MMSMYMTVDNAQLLCFSSSYVVCVVDVVLTNMTMISCDKWTNLNTLVSQ